MVPKFSVLRLKERINGHLGPPPPDQSEWIDLEKLYRLPQRMRRNLDSGARIGSATCLVTLVAIWPQKCKQCFSAIMSLAGQVGHKSYPSQITVPSRGFCFLGKARPGKSCASRISVPSRGFCFLGKTRPGKSCPSRIRVPSMGFCFLTKP